MSGRTGIETKVEPNFETKVPEDRQWQLTITRVSNGYLIEAPGEEPYVIQENENDELKEHEELLWHIMEYFNFGGTKHDPIRLRVKREKQR